VGLKAIREDLKIRAGQVATGRPRLAVRDCSEKENEKERTLTRQENLSGRFQEDNNHRARNHNGRTDQFFADILLPEKPVSQQYAYQRR